MFSTAMAPVVCHCLLASGSVQRSTRARPVADTKTGRWLEGDYAWTIIEIYHEYMKNISRKYDENFKNIWRIYEEYNIILSPFFLGKKTGLRRTEFFPFTQQWDPASHISKSSTLRRLKATLPKPSIFRSDVPMRTAHALHHPVSVQTYPWLSSPLLRYHHCRSQYHH